MLRRQIFSVAGVQRISSDRTRQGSTRRCGRLSRFHVHELESRLLLSLSVVGSYPQNSAQLTGSTTPGFIEVTFNEALNPSTVTATSQGQYTNVQLVYEPYGANNQWVFVPDTVAWSGGTSNNDQIVITPTDPPAGQSYIQPNGIYLVALYSGLKSASGDTLNPPTGQQATYISYYLNDTFGGSSGNPPVTVFAPDGNVIAGDTGESPVNLNNTVTNPTSPPSFPQVGNSPGSGVIVADQFEPIIPSSLTSSNIIVEPLVNGSPGTPLTFGTDFTVTYDPEIPSIEIALAKALTAGNYRFIEQNVIDASGNVLAQPEVLDFNVPTTETYANGQNDTAHSPSVVGSFPTANSADYVSPIIQVAFSDAMNPSTVMASTVLLKHLVAGQWVQVPVTVTYNADLRRVYLIPQNGLTASGTLNSHSNNYEIVVTTGVKDTSGRALTAEDDIPYAFVNYVGTNSQGQQVDGPVVNPNTWLAVPGNGQGTVSASPAAIWIYLAKYNGDQSSSINVNTFSIFNISNPQQPVYVPIVVSYDPWPGAAILVPQVSGGLAPGNYVIYGFANTNPYGPSGNIAGVVDNSGAQQIGQFTAHFTVSGSGSRALTAGSSPISNAAVSSGGTVIPGGSHSNGLDGKGLLPQGSGQSGSLATSTDAIDASMTSHALAEFGIVSGQRLITDASTNSQPLLAVDGSTRPAQSPVVSAAIDQSLAGLKSLTSDVQEERRRTRTALIVASLLNG